MSEQATVKKTHQHKCENCGADMHYAPGKGQLVCDHCGSVRDVASDVNVRERDFAEMQSFAPQEEGETYYRCKNCGASTALQAGTIATTCPFCSAPVVLDRKDLNTIKPDTVIPFETTQEDARSAILKWRKKRPFAPSKFRKYIDIDEVKGVYTPVWTFDSYVNATYNGRLGKHRTRVVRRDGKTYTETYTEWFHVSGTKNRIFDDIFVSGSRNVPSAEIDKLHPFPQEKYRVYNNEYLAGFIADNYSVSPEQAFERAEQRMKSTLEREIASYYAADVVDYLDIDMHYSARTFKFLLLPLYVTATKYKDKVYNNYVSGIVSGRDKKGAADIKVSGKSPKSPVKIGILVLLILALAILLAVFVIRSETRDAYRYYDAVPREICEKIVFPPSEKLTISPNGGINVL